MAEPLTPRSEMTSSVAPERSAQAGYCLSGDSLAATERAHLLRGRELHVELRCTDLHRRCQRHAHRVAVGPELRRLRDNGRVDVDDLVASFLDQPDDVLKQLDRIGPAPGRV